MSISQLQPAFRVPTGIDRLGFPSYGKLPGGVPNPPNAMREAHELQMVRELQRARKPIARRRALHRVYDR